MSAKRAQLRVSFASRDEFQREYRANIASGGLFVACERPLPLRTPVDVELCFEYGGGLERLPAEVVHCVPPELAASGATPGVAVQFSDPVPQLRARLVRHLEDAGSPARKSPAAGPGRPPASAAPAGSDPDWDPERRGAPRAAARVRARVRARAGEVVAARTRDLSRTGVLLSVPTDEIPVGESVRVTLTNPRSGKEMEVAGSVARRIEDDGGGVAAIGIAFEPGPGESEPLDAFLAALHAAEHSRRLGGISGPLSEMRLEKLLPMFGTSAPAGTLTVMRGGEEGYIGFEAGLLLGVRLGATRGVKALARMLSWEDGHFEFHARVDPAEFDGSPEPLAGALAEARRVLDESRRARAARTAPSTILRVDDRALAEHGPLDKLESAVVDLARVGMTVRKITDIIPEPDPEILAALATLTDRGILV